MIIPKASAMFTGIQDNAGAIKSRDFIDRYNNALLMCCFVFFQFGHCYGYFSIILSIFMIFASLFLPLQLPRLEIMIMDIEVSKLKEGAITV